MSTATFESYLHSRDRDLMGKQKASQRAPFVQSQTRAKTIDWQDRTASLLQAFSHSSAPDVSGELGTKIQ